MADTDVVYRIDDRDRIVYVNSEWDSFALRNAGGAVASPFVLQKPLWDFIADDVTTKLYREACRVVREGHLLQFTFRCDSPDCRRLLQMRMSSRSDGLVELRTQTIRVDQRLPQRLLDVRVPRTSESLRLCSWCKNALVGDVWFKIEDAYNHLNLGERGTLPELTQATCESCFQKLSTQFNRSLGA